MENESTFEQLFDKSQAYIKTTIELYTHEAVLKFTNIISNLALNAALFSIIALFFMFVNNDMWSNKLNSDSSNV